MNKKPTSLQGRVRLQTSGKDGTVLPKDLHDLVKQVNEAINDLKSSQSSTSTTSK